MVLNFWSLGTIIVNSCEFLCLLASEGNIISITTVLVTLLLGILGYFSWKSTDTPGDIPTPPLPPFVISIQTTTNGFGNVQRHTLQDIRLFSPQPYLSRVLQQIHTRRVDRGTGDSSSELPEHANSSGTGAAGGPPANSSPSSFVFHRFWYRPRQGTLGSTRSFRTFLRSRFHSPVLFYRLFPRHPHQTPIVTHHQSTPRREVGTEATELPNLINQGPNSLTTDTVDPPVQNHWNAEVGPSLRPDTTLIASGDGLNQSSEVLEASESEETRTLIGGQKEETEMDAPAGPGAQHIKFIIKFLNDTQLDVVASENERVGNFKRRHFSQEYNDNKIVRLIFNGRVMDDTRTLKESGFFESCVVHCLIVTPQPQNSQSQNRGGGTFSGAYTAAGGVPPPHNIGGQNNNNNSRGPEPGMFFVSLMGIILISLWFICFNFGQQLFTQSAVVSLSILTGIFLIGLVAFYLPVHPTPNHGN